MAGQVRAAQRRAPSALGLECRGWVHMFVTIHSRECHLRPGGPSRFMRIIAQLNSLCADRQAEV
jgi:hypothetical protein